MGKENNKKISWLKIPWFACIWIWIRWSLMSDSGFKNWWAKYLLKRIYKVTILIEFEDALMGLKK